MLRKKLTKNEIKKFRKKKENEKKTKTLGGMSVFISKSNTNLLYTCHRLVYRRLVKGKVAEFTSAIEYINPDSIIGTESWLDSSITNAEVFPPNYNIYRKDRNALGGGVFVAIKSEYISSSIDTANTNCESIWSRVDLVGAKSLFIGSF